ncbi:WxL domain-containing protein [Enterococcus rotai]|uniref:WxL domain-containing protein n=1 Tax=Enterococcus rotai TaxID=118060 RepID=UPI0035C6F091
MKKNRRKFIVFLALLLSELSVETEAVWANDGLGNRSNAEISYIENTDITPPMDPTQPDKSTEIISPIPVPPGTSGPLSVDFAPHVIFGEHDGSQKNDVYYAKLTRIKKNTDGSEEEVPNFLQLTDNRGKNAGWRLTVKQNGQLKNSTHSLKGAQMSLKNITLLSPNNREKPIVVKDVQLDPESDEPVEVSRATETTGKGTWQVMFGKDNEESKTSIQVSVPGTTEKKKGNYSTSLTWELIDTPI